MRNAPCAGSSDWSLCQNPPTLSVGFDAPRLVCRSCADTKHAFKGQRRVVAFGTCHDCDTPLTAAQVDRAAQWGEWYCDAHLPVAAQAVQP